MQLPPGLFRGSVPTTGMERPNSLPTKGPFPQTRSWTDSGIVTRKNSTERQNSRGSLSVLSPFDEQEEWLKILEILNACNSGLEDRNGEQDACNHLLSDVQRELQNRFDALSGGAAVDVKPDDVVEVPIRDGHDGDTVADWLLSLGLQQYLGMLMANGFDDIDFLGDGIMDDASLMEMGVLEAGHRTKLVEAAAKLPPTPLSKMDSPGTRPTDLDQWLHLIRLDHYAEQFRKNGFDDMDRVSRIWEVELTTLVEIRLIGHLRRILTSLQRPSGQQPTGPTVQQHPPVVYNPDDLSLLSTDLQKISTNLAKLGDEISQKMSETTNGPQRNGTLGRRKSKPAPQPPSHRAVESILEELTIRNPSELVIGIAKTVATQWRHQPKHLLRPGVYYEAQYLGSTLVRHVRGTESTKRSIQKLKRKHAEEEGKKKKRAEIMLAISLSGVQFLDPSTKETICKHDIRNINWACQDADDLTHFAYITKDQDCTAGGSEEQHFCHVFQVPTMDLAMEVILTLGQAFEVAYQLVLREDLLLISSPPQQSAVAPSQPVRSGPSATAAKKPVKPAIGPKPAVLPKPKLGTGGLLLHSKTNQHTRSQSSIDTGQGRTSGRMPGTRLQSESNLAVLSGRAPLAAKDEL